LLDKQGRDNRFNDFFQEEQQDEEIDLDDIDPQILEAA